MTDKTTTWRATVRGVTSDSKAGSQINRVIVRKNVIVRMGTPRFMRKGDEITIPVIAHNYLDTKKQIQLQLGFPQNAKWVELFMGWWEYAIRSWRCRAGADATLTFLCELGPPEYAMTGADGYELSDRWEEAGQLKDMIRELWERTA